MGNVKGRLSLSECRSFQATLESLYGIVEELDELRMMAVYDIDYSSRSRNP